jgi:hypothetical protein
VLVRPEGSLALAEHVAPAVVDAATYPCCEAVMVTDSATAGAEVGAAGGAGGGAGCPPKLSTGWISFQPWSMSSTHGLVTVT